MLQYFDIWKFLAGLASFLFGMQLIEVALKSLVGRSFKIFLRTQTTNPVKGIIGGTIITGILQSSSVVSLMVLAFVGAGILNLQNAIGVIFGANLGTTFTGWIVATLGFKMNIEAFSLPIIAVGGLLLTLFSKFEKLDGLGRFLLGFGMLFIGLTWMKDSIDYLANNFDLGTYKDFALIWFFVIGLILTTIIQSSSAVMVITLSALNAGIIPLEAGAMIVIGSNLGTTITVVFGAIKGSSTKKRVAASHVVFNIISSGLALALMYPLLWLFIDLLKVESALYTLVFFHSSFNLLGIVVLIPFIKKFSRFMERFFNEEQRSTKFISNVPSNVPEAAIEALRKEIVRLTGKVFNLNVIAMDIKHRKYHLEPGQLSFLTGDKYLERYMDVKRLEGEIVEFYQSVQNEKLADRETDELNRLIQCSWYAMHSAKSIKDVVHNIKEHQASGNDSKFTLYNLLIKKVDKIYLSVFDALFTEEPLSAGELLKLKERNYESYQTLMKETYQVTNTKKLSDIELATLLSMNRQIHNATEALLLALSGIYNLDEQLSNFESIPVQFNQKTVPED